MTSQESSNQFSVNGGQTFHINNAHFIGRCKRTLTANDKTQMENFVQFLMKKQRPTVGKKESVNQNQTK